jgi:GNAT superfamily N-acetyltransferase
MTTPATTTDDDVLRRALAFELALLRGACDRVVGHALGEALFHDDLRQVWVLNQLIVAADEASADELTGALDELYGHLAHRRAMILRPPLAARIGHELRRADWLGQRDVYMVLRRERDRPPAAGLAREVDEATLRAVEAQTLAEEPQYVGDVVEQLLAMRAAVARVARARYFVAAADGVDAGHATLYSDGVVAQVEDVGTVSAMRGRGLARAAVSAAVEAAVDAGHELVFIVADDDDWPKQLYAKLGFDPVGIPWSVTRPGPSSRAPRS